MQNLAAWIVTRSPKHDHITPVLEQLHWLPVRMRVLYNLLVLTYGALEGKGPSSGLPTSTFLAYLVREITTKYVSTRVLHIIRHS